ncbi:MAG TPA: DUF930 domain-containing protein [Rhizobiaceae bacterium]|nr:DUF930 domain-containing protein [Rhizobiaceae bacterium]
MSPMFHSTSVTMRDDNRDQRRVFGWALPASLGVHLLVVALLIFGLPASMSLPQKEQAVTVDLVPPPEPPRDAEVDSSPAAEKSEPDQSQATRGGTSSAIEGSARHAPSAAIRPVFQFGEKDAGPRVSSDGGSTEDGAPTPAQRDPEERQLEGQPAPAEGGAANQAPPPEASAHSRDSAKLQEAKRLFSQAASGRATATTAMAGVPRPIRAGRLCLTELRAQLLNSSPPVFPDLLPSEWKNDGTTVDIPNTAFRAGGQWYNLSYRCKVDGDATKVVSFAFRVGEPVPRSEWKRRGLPSQ